MSTTDQMLYAGNTVNQQAGGTSWFDDASDAIIKGGSAALVSGVASIYNTGVAAANYFGADAEKIDVHKALTNVDQNWGDYYDQHQGVIDAAGFIATSFIPGGLAVKGLNLVRRGEGAGAFTRALNYTTEAQTANLEKALQVVASPEGSLFTKMNSSYLKSLAWGTADQTLQTAAFEIAVATTMNQSPILDGVSAKDMAHDVVKNALFGGAFGGAIEGIFMSGIVKGAISDVGKVQRKYDVLGAADGLGLPNSDVAYSFMDRALALPKIVAQEDRSIAFTYKLAGKDRTIEGGLQTGALLDKALQRTYDKATSDLMDIATNKLGGEDSTVGSALAKTTLDILTQGKKVGATDDDLRSKIGELLWNLKGAQGIGEAGNDVTPEALHIFDKKAPTTTFPFKPVDGDNAAVEGSTFRIKNDPENPIKVATLGADANSAKDAWNQGFDLFMNASGTWSINPKSKLVRPAAPPRVNQIIYNIKSGEGSLVAENPTIADLGTKEAPLTVQGNRVSAGDRSFDFKLSEDPTELMGVDSAYYSARHLWADSLKKIDGEVNGNDISLLDKMAANKNIVSETTTVNIDGDVANWRDRGNFDSFVLNRKLDLLQKTLEDGPQDITVLAHQLNATPEWVQNAISSKFDPALSKAAKNAPDLREGSSVPLSEYNDRENLVLSYRDDKPQMFMDDFGNAIDGKPMIPQMDNDGRAFMGDQTAQRSFITGQQSYQYRVKLAQDNLDMTFASVFGSEDAGRFIGANTDELLKLANNNPNGAGLISFANANYGDKLALLSQYTGTQTHKLAEKLANAYISRLQPLMAELQKDSLAAGELTAIVTRVRRSAAKYTIMGPDHGFDGAYLIDKSLLRGADSETVAAVKDALLTNTQGEGQLAFHIESDLVANFLQTHMDINSDIIQKRGSLAVARGQVSLRDPGTLYVPPIDTAKVPYFALVRPIPGKVFADSSVSMITARSAEELQQLAAKIPEDSGLQVIFKKDTENFFKAKGDYDYQRSLSDSTIDSTLKSDGRLGDYLPSFDVQSTLEDFLNYHQRQATQLVRDGVSTKYSQTITELQRLSEQYTSASTSKFGVIDKIFNRSLNDPYDDLIKGMLDVSKRSEFTLLHQTNEMLDAMGTRAYRATEGLFQDLRDKSLKGDATPLDWQQANNQLRKYGLGTPYSDETAFQVSNIPADRNLLKVALQKANMILSTGILRLDFANSLVNIISTPIMLGTELSSIRNSVKNDPVLAGKIADLTSLAIPDGSGSIPSTTKLLANAVKNFWGPDKAERLAQFERTGAVNSVPAIYHEMVNDLSIVPGSVKKYSEGVDKWIEKASAVTGNTWAEQFTRFVSADVMKQITDPLVLGKAMSVAEQDAYISTFVNRVQGNYIAAQRPILFQGTLGSAVGLFQTYQFNMLQQLYRHIENRDLKSAAVFGALQTSVYGANGLPFFDAINTNIIGNASINDGHKDVYSLLTQAAGKTAGDWMMYGTASAMPFFGGQGPSLYTRGDVNPRHPTIIPVSPLDIPAVDATTKFVSNLVSTASKIANGGNVGASLLEGLEHNSINRPLAGLAQAINGYSTTNSGDLIGLTNGQNSELFSIANASRILGAKPLDESIGLNTRFRQLAYQAEDKKRIEELGAAVKTTLRNGQSPDDEQMMDFMGKYASSGGQVQGFGAAMQRWSKNANTSVLNQLSDKVRSPYGQRFVEVMGGTRMPDFNNQTTQPLDPATPP